MDWTSYNEVLDYLNGEYEDAYGAWDIAGDYQFDAYINWMGGSDHAALGDIIQAVKYVDVALYNLIMPQSLLPSPPYFVPLYFMDTFLGVSMTAILNAMYNAEASQVYMFIYYLEAYKMATWNATLFEEQLAELSKRWAVWL